MTIDEIMSLAPVIPVLIIEDVDHAVPLGRALVAGCLLIPVLWGAKIYIGISEARFRQIVLTLLTGSGVALLAASVPQLGWFR